MNKSQTTGQSNTPRHENSTTRRDFYHRFDLLLASWYLLTSRNQQQIQIIRQDLHEDLARWRPKQPEPDWNSYANRVSRICREDGLPLAIAATK